MIAAFFDIDGTLYRNSLLIENFKKLIKYEVVDEMVWLSKVRRPFQEWAIRKGDYENYLVDVADAFKGSLAGIEEGVIDFLANQVIKQNWEKTYVFTRDRILWHKEQGHLIVFISGSPDFLVEKMAAQYDVKHYRASHYLLDEKGCYTGEVEPMWDSANKKKAIHEIVKAHDVDLAQSYAYGDTLGDLSMMEMVGKPVAINPNHNLYRRLLEDPKLRERVLVVVERKDMIYHIDLECTEVFPK